MPARRHRRLSQSGALSVALVYPGPAAQGQASLAMAALADIVERAGGDWQRVFWDGGRARAPVSESGQALSDFDLVLLSTAFEEQWVLVPELIEAAGIPARAARRGADHPPLIAGGFALRLNPAPLAPFVDAIVPGEAEPVLPAVLEAIGQDRPSSRAELIDRLAAIKGVMAGSHAVQDTEICMYRGARPAAQRKIERGSIFKNMLLVETGRGCPAGCRFCAVAHARRPPKFFSPDAVLEAVSDGLVAGQRVGLVGASLSRHPRLFDLLERLSALGVDLSPASLDAAVLASENGRKLIAHLAGAGQRTLTLAPECGSEALRLKIGKRLTDDQLECAIGRLSEAGVLHFKLYFMYGLPGEQPDDIERIIDLAGRARKWLLGPQRRRGRAGRLVISANPFVPKPHTPFAAEPMAQLASLKAIRAGLAKGIGKIGGVSFSGFSPRRAILQCLLDRAGPEMADLLEQTRGRWPPSRDLLRKHLPNMDDLLAGRTSQ